MKGDLVNWLKENSSADNPKRFYEIYEGSGLDQDYSKPKVLGYLTNLVQNEHRVFSKKVSEFNGIKHFEFNVYWVE